ncbi:MAG: hypothetical protein K2M37_07990 [Muribaculaceae bacterium]|nr:hypothetical protein [Muribaculaceae bacterium]
MIDNSQWKNVIHRYGIADRRKQDRSLGVDSIIKSLADSLSGVEVEDDLVEHFERTPLQYIFVNNKTIPSEHRGNESYWNSALTECELTFYQNDDNSIRFRYFIQLTHGFLIHGLSWIKSAPDVKFNLGNKFRKVMAFVDKNFIADHTSDAEPSQGYRDKYGIYDGKRHHIGTMYNHLVKIPSDKENPMEQIATLMKEAFCFFRKNQEEINQIINQ